MREGGGWLTGREPQEKKTLAASCWTSRVRSDRLPAGWRGGALPSSPIGSWQRDRTSRSPVIGEKVSHDEMKICHMSADLAETYFLKIKTEELHLP